MTAGVVSSILTLLNDRDEKATHLAIAFDNPIESFRNELFSGYKTGEGMLPALRDQFDLVELACRAIGVVVWIHLRGALQGVGGPAAVQYLPQAMALAVVLEFASVWPVSRELSSQL